MAKKTKKPNTIKVATVALGLGAIIGAVVGLLNAPKKGSELKKDLDKEAEILWKKLRITKKQVEKTVKDIFGEVSPQTLKYYVKAKSDILARAAKLKDQLSQSEYNKIVDSAIKRVSKSKELQKPLQRLGKDFKKSYKDVKKILNDM